MGYWTSLNPDLYCNQRARQIAPVRMTGNYGSEILRRHRAFRPAPPPKELFSGEFIPMLDMASDTFASAKQGHALTFAAFKQAPWYQSARLRLEQSQLVMRTPYLDNNLMSIVYRAPIAAVQNGSLSMRLIRDGNPLLASIETDRGLGGAMTGPLALLFRGYCEVLFKLEYYANHGLPSWAGRLDHAFKWTHWERAFLGRHKFYHFRPWLRDELSGYVRQVLLDSRSNRPYLRGNYVERIVKEHTQGTFNHTFAINKLLTTELCHRILIENFAYKRH